MLTRHVDIAAGAADPAFSAQGGGSHLDDLPVAVVVALPLELVPAAGRSRPAATDGRGRKERDGDEH